MTRLYVAAGGGGDALAAAILHRALDTDGPAIIATYAWDRLAVDPLPGPRSAAEFTGLAAMGRRNHTITAATRARPPSRSTLPRLAGDLADALVLLDPTEGAAGMAAQLAELAELQRPDTIALVDVGGDALARSDEPGLRSPLADALVLAAAINLAVPVVVLVAGPGLDGELTETEVLRAVSTNPCALLTAADVEPFRPTFEWHPSEATALLAAAARGIRGKVEVRDAGLTVDLTDTSPAVYELPLADALSANPLAEALAHTTALNQAESITKEHCGFSEIDYERAKHERAAAGPRPPQGFNLDTAVQHFEHQALARGIDYVTFRRIAEALGPSHVDTAELRQHLVATRPGHYQWPLWALSDQPSSLRRHARAG